MNENTKKPPAQTSNSQQPSQEVESKKKRPNEVGGPSGPEPTRYGDWERKGIASDF